MKKIRRALQSRSAPTRRQPSDLNVLAALEAFSLTRTATGHQQRARVCASFMRAARRLP